MSFILESRPHPLCWSQRSRSPEIAAGVQPLAAATVGFDEAAERARPLVTSTDEEQGHVTEPVIGEEAHGADEHA